jgi:NADH-quinone oxidoreductase subunit D
MAIERLDTNKISLNMGPQHPSTHGVFRIILTLDGETVVDAEPVLGYLHRGMEKLAEERSYKKTIPLTDRMDYVCAMSNNWPYVLAVEKLAELEVPERAEYIRVIMGELSRVVRHMITIGFLLNELGAYFTPMMWAMRERERVLDLFEMTCGSRMTCNYMRFGGVSQDIPEGFVEETREVIAQILVYLEEIESLLNDNEIIAARCMGIGVLPREKAISYGATGPLLRGSGEPYDVRRAEPYSVYDRFEFEIPTRSNGDVYDRYMMRVLEIRQSVRILEQALDGLPEGPVMSKVPKTLKPPEGDAYARIEDPKGELGVYLVSDGSDKPYRFHVRPPSFVNLGVLRELVVGRTVADVVVIFGSIDLTMGEVDR